MPSNPSPPRRRGAPLGNTNALKHGFYSSRFRKSELKDLEFTDTIALRDEITMLRVCIRRAMEWSAQIQSLTEATNFLRIVSLATANLSRLVRTQTLAAGLDMENPLQANLEEVAIQLGFVDSQEPDPRPFKQASSVHPDPLQGLADP